jgi:hypothetical protein
VLLGLLEQHQRFLDLLELLVLRALQETQELRVFKALRVPLELRVPLVILVFRVYKVQQERQGLQVLLVRQGLKDRKVWLAQLGRRVLLERRV